MQCVILAGGLATRLRPITGKIPKSMVPVCGKPFLEYQLDLLRRNGLTDIVLCVGYLHEQIRDYFGDGKSFGVNIAYSIETDMLLGTAGAIRQAVKLLKNDFFVQYGDSYLDVCHRDIYDYFRTAGCCALMTVYKNENKWDTSNVVVQDGIVKIYDKKRHTPEMKYIDYGLSVLCRDTVVDLVPQGVTSDLTALFGKLVSRGKLAAYEVFNRFYEIGSITGLKEFEEIVSGGHLKYDYHTHTI
jgi:NDP-sugar pyrophosphorylase family protein